MKSFPVVFSSSTLKIIAGVTMAIDHIGFLFFPDQPLWRIVGRLSFPLFAFLIAEGYRHTSDARKYAERLLLFALISQLPFMLLLNIAGVDALILNIFFTLTAGLYAIMAVARLPFKYSLPVIIGIILLAEVLRVDYGAYGVLTILGSYLFLKRRTLGSVALLLLPFLETVITALSGIFFVQFAAVASVPFIARYNGERGTPLPRQLFYWFYPAHILVLCLIWKFLV